MALPVMTPEQRQAALAAATRARKERAAALGLLRDGTVTLAAVLTDKDSPLQKAPVRSVLRAIPGVGDVKADQALAEIRIHAGRRVKGLSARQRDELAARFP